MKHSKRVIIGMGLAVLCAAGARGQDAAVEADPEVLDGLSTLSLEDIMSTPVYAASRREQTVSEAPSSITIFTEDEIRSHAWKTLGEILNAAPGMYASNDRSYGFVGVRGFLRPGDYNSRILVLVNGVRVNEAISGGAGIGRTFPLDVDLIERVEIVRGPSSSLYGTGAFFGVVNVITRSGADLGGIEAVLGGGDNDTGQGRFSYGDRFGDEVELLLSGTYYKSDGDDLYFAEFDDPATNNGKTEDVDKEELSSIFLQLLAGDLSFDAYYNNRTKHSPTAAWETIFNDRDTKDQDKQWGASLSYSKDIGKDWNLYALVNYLDYEYDGDFLYNWADPGDPVVRVPNHDGAESAELGGELKATTVALNAQTITFGTEYRYNIKQDQWNKDLFFSYLDDDRDSYVWSAYAQDEIVLHENIILHAGVRYDYTDLIDQGDVSPRVGLILSPTSSTVLKFLYGEAFRAPSVYELYYHDGNVTTKANSDLDSEKMKTYEIVLEQSITEYLFSSLSVYRYEIDDLISQRVDPGDGLIEYANIDEVHAQGLEWALQGRLFDAIDSRASYSFSNAEDEETHKSLVNSPAHMVKLHCTFPLSPSRFFGGLEVLYTSKRDTLRGNDADEYVVVNTTLLARELPGNLELSASIYNLFDEDYSYPGSGEHLQDTLPGYERSFFIKLTGRF